MGRKLGKWGGDWWEKRRGRVRHRGQQKKDESEGWWRKELHNHTFLINTLLLGLL